jgi:hypothetical protein
VGGNVIEYACSFNGDGVQVQGEEKFRIWYKVWIAGGLDQGHKGEMDLIRVREGGGDSVWEMMWFQLCECLIGVSTW